MKWESAISEDSSLKRAVEQCSSQVAQALGTTAPDMALAFVSSGHSDLYDEVPKLVFGQLKARHMIGCSGGGVIGGGREIENRPAFALTAASLPDVSVVPFHVDEHDQPSLDEGPSAWEKLVQVKAEANPHFVLLPDPFTIHADNLLMGLDYAFKDAVKIGGLASGGIRPGANALFVDGEAFRSGAVGVALYGNIRVDTIVAQGCRPIGKPMIVTRAEGNVMMELDGEKPLDVLRRVFEESDERDRALINGALHLGVVMDPLKEEFQHGDFLIRNLMGLHRETGALVIGEMLREGQVVQFHVRDAQTAEEDLEAMIDRYMSQGEPQAPSGALLFSCVGRGEHLFGRANHDTDIFMERVSRVPMAGFFCNGEIGRVGGSTFLHGFTSSFALFKPAHEGKS